VYPDIKECYLYVYILIKKTVYPYPDGDASAQRFIYIFRTLYLADYFETYIKRTAHPNIEGSVSKYEESSVSSMSRHRGGNVTACHFSAHLTL
jgi:hypothetical protein